MIDPLDRQLGYQLRRASALMMADLARALKPLELRPTEASVLLAIAANQGTTQSDIGRLLGIQRANMAPILATLLARGLVERSASDGRSQGLRPSADGGATVDRVTAVIARHEEGFLPELSADARDLLIAQLRGVRAADPEE